MLTRLRSVPGVGLLTATALVAIVGGHEKVAHGSPRRDRPRRNPPRESSTGLIRRLGAISKRGDTDRRMLLAHGARAVLCQAEKADSHDGLRAWALGRELLRGHNEAALALANKLARTVWAVWTRVADYHGQAAARSNRSEVSHRSPVAGGAR